MTVTAVRTRLAEVAGVAPAARRLRSVELFAGAGGLALGSQLAGFDAAVTLERNAAACDTLRGNKARGHALAVGWDVHEGDVRDFEWAKLEGHIDVVAGGPPCQPFSTGGLGRAAGDERNMFPATADIIARLRPQAFLIENVRGLARKAFAEYYAYVQLRLALPEVPIAIHEGWPDHLARLRRAARGTSHRDFAYDVVATLVNAADYGVPQQRHGVCQPG